MNLDGRAKGSAAFFASEGRGLRSKQGKHQCGQGSGPQQDYRRIRNPILKQHTISGLPKGLSQTGQHRETGGHPAQLGLRHPLL